MPMVEVIHATPTPTTHEQKQAFAEEAVEIFHDVLGTPHGRLRLFFYQLDWEDSIAGLLSDDESGETT
ncbi:MAG: hypothetical protein D6737_08605 [Chloroflexi bacterium]|nr:MAG: hypothetical protein D6737_08605 [Chloroflexota bacterium]